MLFIVFHTEQYRPLDKKNKGTQSKIIVTKLKHLRWVLKRTVSSGHLLAPKTNVWTYDNNIRSEGSKEPSQRDDSFEPPSPPPPKKKKKKKKIYIYIYTYIHINLDIIILHPP